MLKRKNKTVGNLEAQNRSQKEKSPKLKVALKVILPLIPLLIGLYLLSLVFAPRLTPYLNAGKVEKAISGTLPEQGNDRVYIQKLGVNVKLNTGGAEAMHAGNAWHRFPERGDPVKGGNFIISAHRWIRGNTPQETIKQSPFYNTDRLEIGDSIVIDFNGARYKYEIFDIFEIKPDQTEIEEPLKDGEEPYMTLYTCTLKGSADGRVVIRARLVKTS